MIHRITGRVIEIEEKGLVIETSGLGYFVYTIHTFLLGQEVSLFTHFVQKEDTQELYGFVTKEEKDFFIILLGVSGIGPKTALNMMSLYPIATLVNIIKTSDAKSISLVPGIGKKTAEKVVIDLKDKVDRFAGAAQSSNSDLVEVLLSLGYKDIHIREIVGSIDESLSIEKQISTALQFLAKK